MPRRNEPETGAGRKGKRDMTRSESQAERIEFTLAFLNSEWGKTPEGDRPDILNVIDSWAALKHYENAGLTPPDWILDDCERRMMAHKKGKSGTSGPVRKQRAPSSSGY